MSDGRITIDTRLNLKPLDGDLEAAKGKISAPFDEDMQRLVAMAQKTSDKIKMAFLTMFPTDGASGIEQYIASLEKLKAEAEQRQMALGQQIEGGQYDEALTSEYELLGEQISAINEEIAEQTALHDEIVAKEQQEQRTTEEQAKSQAKVTEETKKTQKETHKASAGIGGIERGFKKALKTVSRLALSLIGVRGAYMLVRKVANQFLADNEEMANQLKGGWGALSEILAPIIEKIISLLSTAITWVVKFAQALTGINAIANYNAKALNKQAKATGGAAKAANQLAGFDEMNKLTDSSGGGSAASLFEPVTNAATEFATQLGEKILAGDWTGAGNALGEKFNELFDKIDGSALGKKVGGILHGVIDMAVGFLMTADIGKAVADIFNFFVGIGEGVTSAISEMGWTDNLGERLVEWVKQFLKDVDWAEFFEVTFEATLNSIVFPAKLITGILKALAQSIYDNITKKKEEWDENGMSIGEGILEGIKNAFLNIVGWFGENIFIPLVNAIKDVFGIHSPAEEMQPLGDNIGQGLLEGIKNVFTSIGTWIVDNIWTPFKTGFESAFGFVGNTCSKMKTYGSNMIASLKDGIGDIWARLRNGFDVMEAKIQLFGFNLKEKAKEIGKNFVDGIKGKFDGLKDAIKSGINGMLSAIETALNWFISKMNSVGFSIPDWLPIWGGKTFKISMPNVYLPRLAQGAIVNNPRAGVPFVAGEAGREAILPLDNNTEWIDELASRIGGNITIPIYFDGKQIAKYVVDAQKKREFALNGGY